MHVWKIKGNFKECLTFYANKSLSVINKFLKVLEKNTMSKTNEKLAIELDGVPTGSWRNSEKHFSTVLDNPWYRLIFKLSGEIAYATNDYFKAKNYMPALAPVTAQSITSPMGLGSDSLPVSVELFGRKTYLVDSMQFHLEYLLRQYRAGVFYIMPTFRAEDADDRHLNEFFHIEAEISGGFEDNLKTIEGLIKKYVDNILDKYADEIYNFTNTLDHLRQFQSLVSSNSLPRITFIEAERMLGDNNDNYVVLEGKRIGLTSVAERIIMKKIGSPVWLTHLPSLGVPFYQADSEIEGYSLCADLLMGIGEVVGSGQRHVTYSQTINAIESREVDPTPYDWYLRMKKEYPMATAGFGIGLERLLLWILCHDDIRDTQLIVRQKGLISVP